MTDPRLDFLDRLQAATTARMQQVERVAEQVGALTGEATSPDRLVTVKVSSTGALLGLELDDDAMDLDATKLAALVLATARTATQQAALAMKTAVEPLEAPLVVDSTDRNSDDAMDRAERVINTVEDAIRVMDAGPR